jgi:hypothetical protein
MNGRGFEDRDKYRKDLGKRAVALAMHGKWEQAASVNRTIVREFPDDLEAYNRLGKALSELGRNREAKAAFETVLQRSRNNSIAKKNFARLTKLADDASPRVTKRASRSVHAFIEESGKAGVTTLTKPAPTNVLLELTPGDLVQLSVTGRALTVTDESGAYIGQVEPRVGSRIARLIKGGNRYEATVTSAGDQRLDIIIRETYKSPSQMGVVSFPLRGSAVYGGYLPSQAVAYDAGDDEMEIPVAEKVAVKDWSNDDTEPGDDEAFSPVIHRIINSPGEDMNDDY